MKSAVFMLPPAKRSLSAARTAGARFEGGWLTHAGDVRNYIVSVQDAAYYGHYTYPYDAIGPECGNVKLEIFSLKKKDMPETKTVPVKVADRVWSDFEAYRKSILNETIE